MSLSKEPLAFLRELVASPTPSGYEAPGQKIVAKYLDKYADRVTTDVHGNVCGVLNPAGKIKVMLAGHCDEIGLMIMHIEDKGFLYFSAVGGVNLQLLQGETVSIYTANGVINGVIGVKPIHLMDESERTAGVKKIATLWIDIGAKDKKDAEKYVRPGDVATVNKGWFPLQNGVIACRGFDDRIGAFVIADVLRALKGAKLKSVAVYAVSTVQEEIGLRGATTAARDLQPDVGIAVDVGFATDAPEMEAKQVGEAKLGAGPILHRGANFNHRLFDLIEKTAKAKKIPTQLQPIPRGSGTDANAIQMANNQAAAALISIPNRYMHSPVEAIHLDDVANAVELIAATISALTDKLDFVPR
jgi:endoglucanase